MLPPTLLGWPVAPINFPHTPSLTAHWPKTFVSPSSIMEVSCRMMKTTGNSASREQTHEHTNTMSRFPGAQDSSQLCQSPGHHPLPQRSYRLPVHPVQAMNTGVWALSVPTTLSL